MRIRMLLIAALLAGAGAADAQSLPDRLLTLVRAHGVSGHEDDVRDAVRAQLPRWTNPRVDEIGNLIVSIGSGRPHTVLVASLDEGGYLVSRITDDGFLRLHRLTSRTDNRFVDQFALGQPVVVRTSGGRLIPGVTATPSSHFSGLVDPTELARVKGVDDLWVDLGATSAADVQRLGVRMLDAVSLRDRAQPLAAGKVAGVASQSRAGAQALVELLRGFSDTPAVNGTVTVAWVAQSQFGSRGLARLANDMQPERAFLIRSVTEEAPALPAGWDTGTIRMVPALFTDTPVEVVDTADIVALARDLSSAAGLPSPTVRGERATDDRPVDRPGSSQTNGNVPPALAVLQPLLETSGVSGHEASVREAVMKRLPTWAMPQVDERGNLAVTFGSGGKELLFVAHLDEVGFEITDIRSNGTATLRARGGMFPSLYEAHPVVVQTADGEVPAIITPRLGYATASGSQPEIDALSLYFGTATAAETRALGVAEGQAVTVRKELIALADPRNAGQSMDDRAGSSALLLALQQIDPATVGNRVTFAWSVQEETGFAGAAFLATKLRPQYAFAVDTFVSSDTPLDIQHLAHATLGGGAVLRGVDSRTLVPTETLNRLATLASGAGIPLQVGITQGSTDASVFSARGAIDVGLAWPGRYSHSPVEVIDRRDLESLAHLIAVIAKQF